MNWKPSDIINEGMVRRGAEMYNILIVDDEIEQCKALKIMIERYRKDIRSDICTNLKDAKECCVQKKYDIYFLDMKLDKTCDSDDGGLQLGKFIRSLLPYRYTPIVYVTSVPEKIHEALTDTECYRYVLKPYKEEEIYKCLDSIMHSPLMKPATFSFQSFWGGDICIPEASIIYICSGINRRLQIYTEDGQYETTSYTLERIGNILQYDFLRCHRKYIVNIKRISGYDRSNRLLYMGNVMIPLGRKYKQEFEQIWRVR